jgi:hypothetical protein
MILLSSLESENFSDAADCNGKLIRYFSMEGFFFHWFHKPVAARPKVVPQGCDLGRLIRLRDGVWKTNELPQE